MILKVKEGLVSERVSVRILWLTLVFVIVFFGTVILSFYLLPEGLLLRKNTVTDFQTSENVLLCAAQIFFFNMLSVAFIFLGSAFARKREGESAYRSYGQIGFLVFVLLDAVTLGTWSFTANPNAVPLLDRMVRTFDVVHNAGLVELFGQLLITSALATKYLVMTEGKTTTARSIRVIRINKAEFAALVGGFALMVAGALVESRAIC